MGSAGLALGLQSATAVASRRGGQSDYVAGWGEGQTLSPINKQQSRLIRKTSRVESSSAATLSGVLSRFGWQRVFVCRWRSEARCDGPQATRKGPGDLIRPGKARQEPG